MRIELVTMKKKWCGYNMKLLSPILYVTAFITGIVLLFVLVFYVPTVMESYASLGRELPLPTIWVASISNFARTFFLFLLLPFIGFYVVTGVLTKEFSDKVFLKVGLGVVSVVIIIITSIMLWGINLGSVELPV